MTTTDTPIELASKRPAQAMPVNAQVLNTKRGPDGRYRATRGGATARKVWITAVTLILIFLFAGFILSMLQQYS